MMEKHEAKSLHKFTFVSGGTKGILKSSKQLTKALFEKMSSRRNIKSDSIAAYPLYVSQH